MTHISPSRVRRAIFLYLFGGLCLGLCNRSFGLLAARMGLRPGWGTMLNVNLIVPAFAALVAWFYPRWRSACLGGVLLGAMFYLGMRLVQNVNVTSWTARGVLVELDPILVVASLGYAAVGSVAALVVRPWRCVSEPDEAARCRGCGYLLFDLRTNRCPECGASFDPDAIERARASLPAQRG